MSKPTLTRSVKKFKARLQRKHKYSSDKSKVLKFVFEPNENIVRMLKSELEVMPSLDVYER